MPLTFVFPSFPVVSETEWHASKQKETFTEVKDTPKAPIVFFFKHNDQLRWFVWALTVWINVNWDGQQQKQKKWNPTEDGPNEVKWSCNGHE